MSEHKFGAEQCNISKKENLLPMGLAEGYVVKRRLFKDQIISLNDVQLKQY